jgi:hypothetical protein
VATFPSLAISNPGNGYTLTASATGLSSVTTAGIDVASTASNNATQLSFYQPPSGPFAVGTGFNLTIVGLTSSSALASSFNGTVSLTVISFPPGGSLGGTTTMSASGGVASFTGLTFNVPGSYVVEATSSGLASAMTATLTATSTQIIPPDVQSATVYAPQKVNPKTHRKVGKPVLKGYQFTFDTTMSSSVFDSNNYQVEIFVPAKGRGKHKTQAHYQPVGFSLSAVSNTTVQVLTGGQKFKTGGEVVLLAPGITSAAGASIAGNITYKISPGGLGISRV